MCLLYLVKEEHARRGLADGIGEESALVVADIAGRRADEFGNGVLLGVFAHVETYEGDAQFLRQHLADLGLAHAGRSDKEERRHGFPRLCESGLRHHHSAYHAVDGSILAIDFAGDASRQSLQFVVALRSKGLGIDATDIGEDVADDLLADLLITFRLGKTLLVEQGVLLEVGSGLVDDVDGLVGKETVVDEGIGLLHGIAYGFAVVAHAVMTFVTGKEAIEDGDGLLDRGLLDIDESEASGNGLLAGHRPVVVLIGGAADEADAAVLEIGFEHVGGIDGIAAAAGFANAVDFVDVDNAFSAVADTFEHGLHAFLEFTVIAGSCHHRGHLEGIDLVAAHPAGYPALINHPHQTIDKGGLAHTGFADEKRVVLVLAAEDADASRQFALTAHKGIAVHVDLVETGDQVLPRFALWAVVVILLIVVLLEVAVG